MLSHCRCLKIPLLLWLERQVISFLMKTCLVVVGGFFLVLGSSMYSIRKWISRIVASCLGQESGIFLCEWHAQNQTWHHSCWCASDWANAIIIIPYYVPSRSRCCLTAFYLPFIPQLQLSTVFTVCLLSFFKLVLVWLYVGVWVVSCGYPGSGLVLTNHLINSSHCQIYRKSFVSVQYLLLQCMLELS